MCVCVWWKWLSVGCTEQIPHSVPDWLWYGVQLWSWSGWSARPRWWAHSAGVYYTSYFWHSVQFSKNISIAQLSRMSHCAPEATLNPIRFLKFTPETVVRNVFVAQVCWQAVPDTWPGNSKAPVAKCVVCVWNSARSVGRRAKPASRTFWDQVYVVWCKSLHKIHWRSPLLACFIVFFCGLFYYNNSYRASA